MKKGLLIFTFLTLLGSINSIAQGSCNAFYQYTLGLCPDVMFFDGSTPSGPTAPIVAWYYDFGDGTNSTMQSPTHTYTANGNYYACLTIIGADSCVSTYCDSITINCIQGSGSCQAAFQFSDSACPSIDFMDGSSSNVGISDWYWSFGDGSTSTSQNPTHLYGANGQYLVCLSIVASDSCVDTYCDTVTISCISSVDELTPMQLNISPNPSAGKITVELENQAGIQFRITDLSGKIYQEGNKESFKQHTFDVSDLNNGVYLLEVIWEDRRSVSRFIKQ